MTISEKKSALPLANPLWHLPPLSHLYEQNAIPLYRLNPELWNETSISTFLVLSYIEIEHIIFKRQHQQKTIDGIDLPLKHSYDPKRLSFIETTPEIWVAQKIIKGPQKGRPKQIAPSKYSPAFRQLSFWTRYDLDQVENFWRNTESLSNEELWKSWKTLSFNEHTIEYLAASFGSLLEKENLDLSPYLSSFLTWTDQQNDLNRLCEYAQEWVIRLSLFSLQKPEKAPEFLGKIAQILTFFKIKHDITDGLYPLCLAVHSPKTLSHQQTWLTQHKKESPSHQDFYAQLLFYQTISNQDIHTLNNLDAMKFFYWDPFIEATFQEHRDQATSNKILNWLQEHHPFLLEQHLHKKSKEIKHILWQIIDWSDRARAEPYYRPVDMVFSSQYFDSFIYALPLVNKKERQKIYKSINLNDIQQQPNFFSDLILSKGGEAFIDYFKNTLFPHVEKEQIRDSLGQPKYIKKTAAKRKI